MHVLARGRRQQLRDLLVLLRFLQLLRDLLVLVDLLQSQDVLVDACILHSGQYRVMGNLVKSFFQVQACCPESQQW